jgi:hypothetical protein
MGKIVVSENVSLDGVVQDPTGEEGFRRGGWFSQMSDKDREEWGKVELGEALDAEALLLGRRSYEFFAARWPSRSGHWADRLTRPPERPTTDSRRWTTDSGRQPAPGCAARRAIRGPGARSHAWLTRSAAARWAQATLALRRRKGAGGSGRFAPAQVG